jgi:DNA polymerase IV (family X)
MDAEEIAGILENFGRLLELKGENPFKVRAYANAVRALETLPEPVERLVAEGRIGEIDGIGKAIAEKITTLVQTGRLPQYDELRASFPPDILTLFELQGLGAKKIKALYDAFGISSITSLARACEDGRVAGLPGFGPKSCANILAAIQHRKRNAGVFLLGETTPIAQRLLDDLRSHPEVSRAEVAGSFRRSKEIVHDLDLIVATKEPQLVSEDFAGHELVERVLAAGATKTSVVLKNGMQCDLRVVSNAEFPFALQYFSGSKEHNVRLRSRALERGWSLNEYRFSVAEGRELREPIPDVREEADIYRALGLRFIPPELREDRGEIDAAANGTLPQLIEVHHLRGTFHTHTTASDGRSTLEQMAEAAIELGLEYLGIADHSKSSVQANGLDAKRLADQRARIAGLNAGYDGFRLFAGTECDILKDGTLDFPDEVLASLDFVVASVHASFTMTEAEMTKRIIRAMENPYVTMLGHLTGRLLTTREPYKVDVPAIIEAAAATGTIIELNANPRRLDMDWRWWPLAKEKGVKCSINPDAHSARGLQDLAFGVRLARKGWLTRQDVVNCLPAGKIEAVLGAKRIGAAAQSA